MPKQTKSGSSVSKRSIKKGKSSKSSKKTTVTVKKMSFSLEKRKRESLKKLLLDYKEKYLEGQKYAKEHLKRYPDQPLYGWDWYTGNVYWRIIHKDFLDSSIQDKVTVSFDEVIKMMDKLKIDKLIIEDLKKYIEEKEYAEKADKKTLIKYIEDNKYDYAKEGRISSALTTLSEKFGNEKDVLEEIINISIDERTSGFGSIGQTAQDIISKSRIPKKLKEKYFEKVKEVFLNTVKTSDIGDDESNSEVTSVLRLVRKFGGYKDKDIQEVVEDFWGDIYKYAGEEPYVRERDEEIYEELKKLKRQTRKAELGSFIK